MAQTLIERVRLAMRLRRRLASRAARVAAAEAAFAEQLAALGPDDIAIDCGANVGLVAERISETGATLHAFEPDPDAFRALSARLGHLDTVTLHQAAVGLSDETVQLFGSVRRNPGDQKGSTSSSLLSESKRVSPEPLAEVRQIDFPAFLAALPQAPALIKIDIEGAEVALLEALLDSGLLNGVRAVFVETHEKQLPSLRARTFGLIDRAADAGGRINLDWG